MTATAKQVRRAFLRLCYINTKSLSLVRECSKLFDEKKRPEPVIDNKLALR
jgi:hypothetical protein